MGCNCHSNENIVNETEIKFKSDTLNTIEKINTLLKCIPTQTQIEEKEKFIEDLKDNKSYKLLESIKIEQYTTFECINAYETFMQNKKKFVDIYDKEFPLNNSNKLNNKDNINNNIEEKLFKMPPIQHLDNTIYEGEFFFDKENNEWIKGGEGTLITSKNELILVENQKKEKNKIDKGTVFYPNGDIFIGELNKEEPYNRIKGIYFENDYNNKYDNIIISNNYDKEKSKIVKHFSNGNIYEGDAQFEKDKYIFSGKGKLINLEKNIIYDGEFKGGLYNGEGKLFKSKEEINNIKNIEKSVGKTIITNWVNGKPNGEGLIKEKKSLSDDYNWNSCVFRFGKIIKSTVNLVKGKKVLHENIFNFLPYSELPKLVGKLKTKSFLNFLKKENNFMKIKTYNATLNHEMGLYNKDIINYDLFNIKKENSEEIYSSLIKDENYLLPYVCYYTDGGEIEKRYRAYHIFNPNKKKIYSTNYLSHKSTNIILKGIFNKNLYEEFKIREEFVYDKNYTCIENFKQMASLYVFFYEKFERNYPVRKIDSDIIDYSEYIIDKDKLGNYDTLLCTIHYIIFSVPQKIDELTVLMNPCYFFAVYLGNYKNEINSYLDITDEEIKQNNYDMNLLRDKYCNDIIKFEKEKNLFEYIEFNTLKQKEFDMKILCLVKIYEKNDLSNPYMIKLKQFYHCGNTVYVKLINQYNCYNKSNDGYSIDFGMINFYGNVIYLNE